MPRPNLQSEIRNEWFFIDFLLRKPLPPAGSLVKCAPRVSGAMLPFGLKTAHILRVNK